MLKWTPPLQVAGGGVPEFAPGLIHRQCPLIGRRVRPFVSLEQIPVHPIVRSTFEIPCRVDPSLGSMVQEIWRCPKGPATIVSRLLKINESHAQLQLSKQSVMARCAFCKSQEARLCEYGVPICGPCLDLGRAVRHGGDIRSALDHDLLEATLQVDAASTEFKSMMEDIPSGLPHPDGTQRIQNSSRKLAAALRQREHAHNRLDDYLSRGIVPEDLMAGEKRNPGTQAHQEKIKRSNERSCNPSAGAAR